ncbi:MAG: RES family NAD+ phosphorylase [Deltaproteobacteria bacterium]|nr:RES family NAD+ phosphorylase [Deltaproteobacteria bacterium]
MITSWRVVKAIFQNSAFDGEGARIYGGRWNSKGTPVVYTAGSLALASLEILVNIPNDQLLQQLVRIPVEFSPKFVSEIDVTILTDHWDGYPASHETKLIGDQWVKNRHSVILKVPSAIIPEEFNYLINPYHPDFKKLSIGSPAVYYLNSRFKKT